MGFVRRLNSRDLVNDPCNGAEVYPITATNAVYRAGTDKTLEKILTDLENSIDKKVVENVTLNDSTNTITILYTTGETTTIPYDKNDVRYTSSTNDGVTTYTLYFKLPNGTEKSVAFSTSNVTNTEKTSWNNKLEDVIYGGSSIVSNKVATINDEFGYVHSDSNLKVTSFHNVNSPEYSDLGYNGKYKFGGIIARVNNKNTDYNLVIPGYGSHFMFTNFSSNQSSLDYKFNNYYCGPEPEQHIAEDYIQSNHVTSTDHTNLIRWWCHNFTPFVYFRTTAGISHTPILPCFIWDLSIQNNSLKYKRHATIDEIINDNMLDGGLRTAGTSDSTIFFKEETLNLPVPTVDYPVTDVKIRNTSVVTNKIANMDVVKNNNTIYAVQYVASEQAYQSMTKDPNTLYFIPVENS